MFKRFRGILFLTALSCSGIHAQLADTIKYSLHQKPKFFATLASFNTFIDGDFANFDGLRIGLNYNQRIRFGIGYFNLSNNVVVSTIHINENNLNFFTNGNLHFYFFSLSAEYFFYSKYPWQFTVTPFQIGFGRAKYHYINRPGHESVYTPTETILLYQPDVSAQYNIFPCFGVGVAYGYRFTLYRSKDITQHLNAPTFSIDIRLFLDVIYKSLFEKD